MLGIAPHFLVVVDTTVCTYGAESTVTAGGKGTLGGLSGRVARYSLCEPIEGERRYDRIVSKQTIRGLSCRRDPEWSGPRQSYCRELVTLGRTFL